MITKDKALEVLASLDTIAFPALDGPSLYFKELECYILGEDRLVDYLPKRVAEEGTLLHKVKDLDWPEGAVCVVQDRCGPVKWIPSMPCGSGLHGFGGSSTSPDSDGDWWFVDSVKGVVYIVHYAVDGLYSESLASDWNSSVVTKEMWETVQ